MKSIVHERLETWLRECAETRHRDECSVNPAKSRKAEYFRSVVPVAVARLASQLVRELTSRLYLRHGGVVERTPQHEKDDVAIPCPHSRDHTEDPHGRANSK